MLRRRWSCPATTSMMICTLHHDVAGEVGSRFTLREGGKTIGTGIITKILEHA
ncbi:hypothetical protein C8T65DRAFT_825848 [Cerioporus squamosus]|nr:hypothetical protein C8T65DRAFT_825848 [Cerioporus squamosus]